MLLILGALFLGLAAFVAVEATMLPARQRRDVVRRASTYGALQMDAGLKAGGRSLPGGRLFEPLVASFGGLVLRLLPRATRRTVTDRLLQAGRANRITADGFLTAKGLCALGGIALGVLIGMLGGIALGVLFAVALGLIGFVLPDMYANSQLRQRREDIQAALPDSLNLLAVTVEAGLGFDAALAKLTDRADGPLAEEFALALNEMRIGERRIDALKRMAARVDVRELNSFVRAVVQADQLGMSMGSMLRVQAADVRTRRQLAAEEKAMKMPIKMVFPMVFFIMPAMFIVILGPFFLDFGRTF